MKDRNEEIEQICAYCENAVVIRESDICICKLNGAVAQSSTCKKFAFDLLKLAPMPKKLPDDDTVFFDIQFFSFFVKKVLTNANIRV